MNNEKTIDDFFDIQGNTLKLKGVLQTQNFIPGSRGVQIQPNGLNANGGTINLSNTLSVAQGGTGASTLTGILKGNGTGAVTAIVPLAGTKIYWVSDSSGGAVNRKLTFTNGILTAET